MHSRCLNEMLSLISSFLFGIIMNPLSERKSDIILSFSSLSAMMMSSTARFTLTCQSLNLNMHFNPPIRAFWQTLSLYDVLRTVVDEFTTSEHFPIIDKRLRQFIFWNSKCYHKSSDISLSYCTQEFLFGLILYDKNQTSDFSLYKIII